MTNSVLCGEGEPRRLFFYLYISNLPLCASISFVIIERVINKVNDQIQTPTVYRQRDGGRGGYLEDQPSCNV